MFSTTKALNKEIEYYKDKVATLNDRIRTLEHSRDEWERLAKGYDYKNGSILIDWDSIPNVVSIERCPRDKQTVDGPWITTVCYFVEHIEGTVITKKLKEMIFFTDKKQHEDIIATYNEYVKPRKRTKK